jgi:PAS domain S-box-containing protein
LLSDLAQGISLKDTLEHLLLLIERLEPGARASVLLVEGARLRFGAGPSLPEAYNSAVDGVPVGEGFGSCGTSAHRGELVIVDDIFSDPLWTNYREIARRHELSACWSMPIFGRAKEVLGTFALYYAESRRPQPDELQLVRDFSELAAIAIEFRRMEQKLRETETGFRELVEDLDAIVWEANAETRQFTYVSRRAVEMLGYPLERWYSEPGFWESLLYPEDREAAVRRYRDGARSGGSYESEYRMVAADGRIVWVRDLVSVKACARGIRMRGVMANISRQREAEEEREQALKQLTDERALLRAVVEQMPEGVVVVDAPSGRLLMANRHAEMLLHSSLRPGTTLEESSALRAKHPNGRAFALSERPMIRAIRDGETAMGEEIRVPQTDGGQACLAVSAAPVRDREGRIVAGVASLSDVTERKREEAVQRLLADAGSIVGGTLDPDVTLRDLGSLATRELADWCAAFLTNGDHSVRCAAFCHRDAAKASRKVDLDRLLPQPGGAPLRLSSVLATGHSQLFSQFVPDDLEPGAVRSDLLRLMRELGTESAMTVALRRPGRSLGALIFASASAEHRYLPQDLVVAEELARRASLAVENAELYRKAQEAIAQREQFLAVAAHELKTPLTSLQLSIQSIRRQLAKPGVSAESLWKRALAGESQSLRLAGLIDDLLDVSRMRAGRLRLAPEPMDLVQAIHRVVTRFRDELTAKGVEVVVHAPSPVMGRWDVQRIEQVITNLVSNGIKYGEGRAVLVTADARGETAILRVEDHGAGMDAKLIQRLFQPFERGVPAGQVRGLGLGLYITAQIVEAHGGRISVQSTPGAGSTFVVELPLQTPAAS